ncbi:RNA-directed DNA polymerase, eukaryota [Tanacetum coccineum]
MSWIGPARHCKSGTKSNAIFALPGHESTSSVCRKSNAIFALPGHGSTSSVGRKSNAIFGRKLKIDMVVYGWKVRTSPRRLLEDMKREIIVHTRLENCGDDNTLFVGSYKNLPTMIKRLRVDEVDIGCLEKRLELNRLSEHQNVVRFYDIEADETYLYLAFELCSYSLDQYFLLNQDSASEELLEVFRGIITGLGYLNQK